MNISAVVPQMLVTTNQDTEQQGTQNQNSLQQDVLSQDTKAEGSGTLSQSLVNNKKILIVEDELPMAKALEIKLNKSGFSARSVANGEEALAVLRAEPFDLVLLDIMMPVMDGWSFLEQLSNSEIKTKVIVTSNLSQDEDVVKAKSLGAVDFLIKSNESLVDIVAEVERVLAS